MSDDFAGIFTFLICIILPIVIYFIWNKSQNMEQPPKTRIENFKVPDPLISKETFDELYKEYGDHVMSFCFGIPATPPAEYFFFPDYERFKNDPEKFEVLKKYVKMGVFPILDMLDVAFPGEHFKSIERDSLYPYDWDEIKESVLDRDDYKCGNCGSSKNLQVHHIVPLSKGGSDNLSNLRTLCEDCHKKIHPHMQD